MDTRPLYISGNPDMSRIREAKASMNLDFLVVPKPFTDASSVDRILAWGAPPKRLCDYALIGPKTSPEGVVAALDWVLLGTEDSRAMTIEKTLTDIFGFGVRELAPDEYREYDKAKNLEKVSLRLKINEPGNSREGR